MSEYDPIQIEKAARDYATWTETPDGKQSYNPSYKIVARELLRIRKALETWRDEWKKADDPDVYWDAYDTITRIDAILTPDEKELREHGPK